MSAMLDWQSHVRRAKKAIRLRNALRELRSRPEPGGGGSRKHGLPKPLIISLTSYRGRFDTLALMLKSILFQTVRPDVTILWVSPEDFPLVPESVLELRRYGLEVAASADLRSYKKIIPTLRNHKDCFVITVDDDVYYTADCIEQLAAAYDPAKKQVICRRAHRIVTEEDGSPAPYQKWKSEIKGPETSAWVFPTGVLGVLYPPNAFYEDVCDASLFSTLSPSADDIWLYWMWRMNDHVGSKLRGKLRILEWPGTQATSLYSENVIGNGNDRCIQNMIDRYGFPLAD